MKLTSGDGFRNVLLVVTVHSERIITICGSLKYPKSRGFPWAGSQFQYSLSDWEGTGKKVKGDRLSADSGFVDRHVVPFILRPRVGVCSLASHTQNSRL